AFACEHQSMAPLPCGNQTSISSGGKMAIPHCSPSLGQRVIRRHDDGFCCGFADETLTESWYSPSGAMTMDACHSRSPECGPGIPALDQPRSEEHTSELQSLAYLVCR